MDTFNYEMGEDCAICLQQIDPDTSRNEIITCCKAPIHQHCYLECISQHGNCPWCRKDLPISKLFFIGFKRDYPAFTEYIFRQYISRTPVMGKVGIHNDMGPWENLDNFLTSSQKEKIYKKQIDASDIVIVKLDNPELDNDILQYALSKNKQILIVEETDHIGKRSHHKYYGKAKLCYLNYQDDLFSTVVPIRGYYSGRDDYINTIKRRKIESGCFFYRLKKMLGF